MKDSDNLDNRGSGDTSPTLLERVRQNQEDAWERLVRLYVPLVHHWCGRCGLQEADIQDVGQEVFRTVAARLAEFQHDGQPGRFRAWLRSITRNKVGDHVRAARRREQSEGGSDHLNRLRELAEEEEQELTQETQLLYHQALDLLQSEFEPNTWLAFWKVTVENRSPAEVAAELGVAVSTVYVARSRILKRFRQEFSGLVPDDEDAGPQT